ncbi:pumilio domain containing protein [Niveomyces insectorum RCEF 264]|uniref:Pumilio domain containing protein n=1 Tax=Niveomyces insectorum RCEF 264 TaxID=1081102 RepID=A0A162I8Q3_9HYPO|nr:pumilio domain containing protein [Niveomyces insectorum RCEF 264]
MSAVKSGEKRKAASADKPVEKYRAKKRKYEFASKDKKTETSRKDAKNGDGGSAEEKVTNSKEAHAKQKQLALERRAAKPLADELARAKKLWERLRRKSHVPKEERQKLVDELFSITTGRVRDFVLKHDAVRAVQTAVKYSTPEQRKGIARELQGTYAQLAESKYAKFLIGKLLVQNDDETIREMIISEFYGKVRKLINHPEASWILDDMYRGIATKRQKALLLREWYGAEFALANRSVATDTAAAAGDSGAEVTADLKAILEKEPSKRGVILKHLLGMVNALVQKNLTGFTMLHDAMLQYFLNVPAGSEDQKEFIEMVKGDESGDLLKNMAFTRSGARLVCLLLAYGSAKDRKLILRTYKDTFQLLSGDQHGHAIILAAYDLIDDTVLTAKSILPEILGKSSSSSSSKNDTKAVDESTTNNILFCANDLNARTTILYLFEGASKALFPASHAADVAMLEEIWAIRATTSKKEPETRRKELVAAMSPLLLAAIAAAPLELVASSFGCQLVTDVLLFAVGDKSQALEAIAETAAGAPSQDDDEEAKEAKETKEAKEAAKVVAATGDAPPHVSQSLFGTRMLKTLVAGGRFDRETGQVKLVDPPLRFANILYPQIRDRIMAWATASASSAFVVLALLEAADLDPAHAAELKKTLSTKANRKALEKAAVEETAEQKAKREEAEAAAAAAAATSTTKGDAAEGTSKQKKKKKQQQEKVADKKKGPSTAPERPVGNAGAKLLLEKLA